MSKWTKANEYVPVTKGATAVITLQSDGDVYGYMDASTTGVLLASASAGVTKVPTGSFSKITCTAPFILTTESAMSRLRGGQGGTSGGGGSTVDDWITVNDAGEAVLNFPEKSTNDLELFSIGYSRYIKLTGSTGGKINCVAMCWGCGRLKEVDVEVPNGNTSNMFPNCINLIKAKIIAPVSTQVNSIFQNDVKLQEVYLYTPKATSKDYMVTAAGNIVTFSFNLASFNTVNFTGTGVGNLPKLQNLTILEGGLASCTSFIITNSTNLTDESIQNVIDALPDYSGTETSALVSFPPNRLSTEQQAQLTSKGWTWS